MSRYRNPRDYINGTLGFKNSRPITWLEQQKMARENSTIKTKKRKQHIHKDWDKDLWD
jgi:hypothetical protein